MFVLPAQVNAESSLHCTLFDMARLGVSPQFEETVIEGSVINKHTWWPQIPGQGARVTATIVVAQEKRIWQYTSSYTGTALHRITVCYYWLQN